jgi:tripartite motif-containing protein 71
MNAAVQAPSLVRLRAIPDRGMFMKTRIEGSRYAMIVLAAVLVVTMNTLGRAASSGETIYVLDTDNHRVQTFNRDGVYRSQFRHSFDLPTGIALDSNTNVYVKDGNLHCHVDKFDSNGKFILHFGACEHGTIGRRIFDNVGAVATTATGNVWVTSPDFYYMQEFDGSGKFLHIVCMANVGVPKCSPVTTFEVQPAGIALDGTGNIYVTNVYPFTGGNNVVKFNARGKYLATIGSAGSGDGQFNDPEGIAVDPNGNIYVADSGNNRVEVFDRNGVYQSQFGTHGSGNGQFQYPSGIAFGAGGKVYVTDVGNNRVQVFDSNGTYLSQFGSYGQGKGQFFAPIGVAISK